jgi:hypothetical protein
MTTKKRGVAPTLERIDTRALQRHARPAEEWREMAVMLVEQRNALADLLAAAYAETAEREERWERVYTLNRTVLIEYLDLSVELLRFAQEARTASGDKGRRQPKKSSDAQAALLKTFDRMCADFALQNPAARPTDTAVLDWYFAQVRATIGRRHVSDDNMRAKSKTFRNLISSARKALRSNPEKG